MFPSTALLSFVLAAFAIGASANPVVTRDAPAFNLAFARKVNTTGFASILEADQARAKVLKSVGLNGKGLQGRSAVSSFAVTNTAVTYTTQVGVGTPATYYTLLIDTGSSNTWIGADLAYVKTSTSVSTGKKVSVSYGSGSFSGTEYTDTVTLDSALVITGQGIGVASTSTGFDGVDGILGIGPVYLTTDTVTGITEVPTVTDNLYTKGIIPTEVIGVSYEPTTVDSVTNGELTFGGVDTTKYTGTLTYTALTTTEPASYYWGVNEAITYGTTSILASTAGIVDTGTTLILIATNGYTKYVSATGAKLDSTTGLLKITATQYAALKPLNFVIGGVTYALSANAQIWPRSLNTYIGGTTAGIYLVVGDLGSDSGEGLDFIDGYTFLERYYSVFDTTNSRLGFASTAYTTATTN